MIIKSFKSMTPKNYCNSYCNKIENMSDIANNNDYIDFEIDFAVFAVFVVVVAASTAYMGCLDILSPYHHSNQ